MHNINWIRQNAAAFKGNIEKRGEEVNVERILDLDKDRRALVAQLQQLQQLRNEKSKSIGAIKDKQGEEFLAAKNEVHKVNDQIQDVKSQEQEIEKRLKDTLSIIPNLLAEDVPDGLSEEQNIVVDKYGNIRSFDFAPKHHFELGEDLGMMDFEQAAKISGSRFVILKSDLSKLERALANFMIDVHTKEFGFTEISPPSLVKSDAMYGTGNLPKFHEDAFETKDGYWLIPTSEVPLTNTVMEQIVSTKDLPIRYTAFSPCFRSEAGSACRDTRGMIRLHQFSKVELVTISSEEDYEKEYSNLTKAAESILKKLHLPYQKVLKCAGDTTFSAEKTYDLEVWLPGQDCYREISSCSCFRQFQARRMNARYRPPEDKETKFLYTMNGSGLAIGRTIVAIMENYQNADGSITIPDILHQYMGGQIKISLS